VPTIVPPEAVAALSQGNKIEAIKIVRAANRTGLKEAKEAVEAYVLTQPTLQTLLAERQEASKRTLML
jgi:ribosomal protein L7/L12